MFGPVPQAPFTSAQGSSTRARVCVERAVGRGEGGGGQMKGAGGGGHVAVCGFCFGIGGP